ncbi:hypothetical protein B0T24DRAFT_198880 [Lasiosphaeria ovina]|uniref:Uncharacterized protein n=1 Tax=Lasiosphaeria ovina TaxID=92902 RepID=A0AAE0NFR6_9PEZI|nr:hypothetical protein B0T24DRAFT_198880 [Lasiosphaeria ovina]
MKLVEIERRCAQQWLRLFVLVTVKLEQSLPFPKSWLYLSGSEDTISLLAHSDTHSLDEGFCPGGSWTSTLKHETHLITPKEKGEDRRHTTMPNARRVWVWRCHKCFAGPFLRGGNEECQNPECIKHKRCEVCFTHFILKRLPATPPTPQ